MPKKRSAPKVVAKKSSPTKTLAKRPASVGPTRNEYASVLTNLTQLIRDSRRRALATVNRELVLLPGRRDGDDPRFLESAGITPSDIGLIELRLDVQALIKRGQTDDQIRQALDPDQELPQEFLADVIAELRSRQ